MWSHLVNLLLEESSLLLLLFLLLSRLRLEEFDVSETCSNLWLQLVLQLSKLDRVLESHYGSRDLLLQVRVRFTFLFKAIEVLCVQHIQSVVLSHEDLGQ